VTGDRSAHIAAYLAAHPGGVRAADVAAALRLDHATARTYLQRAADSGRARRLARGLYGPLRLSAVPEPPGRNTPERESGTPTPDATPLPRPVSHPRCPACYWRQLQPVPAGTRGQCEQCGHALPAEAVQ
jgi:hypothetical protein